MTNKVLFVSERTIKDSSIIEETLDSKILKVSTLEIQELELKPIIGKKLYIEIEDEIVKKSQDNSYEIPEKYLDMLESIKPFIVYGVLTTIIIPLTYKATNKGFAVKNDTNADVQSGRDLQYIMNFYKSKFDAYKNRLIEEFGKHCSTDFMEKDLGQTTGWYIQNKGKIRNRVDRIVNKY